MASALWPPQYSLFQYLRLKVIVTLLRLMLSVTNPAKLRRDRSLVPLDVRKERIKIPSRDLKRHILADVYYPPGYTSSSPAPVLVNWHGSGFILPLLGSDVLFCSRIAQAGIVVVDADYLKGPEHPFPGAINDVEDTFRWVAAQGGLDSKNVAVSGFSAGACLALVAASTLRKKQTQLNIRAVVSVSPITDLSMAPEERKVPHPIEAIPPWALHLFIDCYAPDKASRTNPAVSPAFADPADFPPTTAIVISEGDILWPEAERLAKEIEKLQNDAQHVVLHMLKGVSHGFSLGAEEGTLEWTRREEAHALATKVLKTAFGL
jgi:acetyl esterase/lipase